MKPRKQVAASAVVSMVVLIAAQQERKSELPPIKQIIAWAFVFFVLSALADFEVEFAGAFAVLAMVAIILSQGEDALKYITNKTGTNKKGKRG